jgi:hypothetical protein
LYHRTEGKSMGREAWWGEGRYIPLDAQARRGARWQRAAGLQAAVRRRQVRPEVIVEKKTDWKELMRTERQIMEWVHP